MPENVLESFIRQYIEAQDVPVVSFAWQGGEPTLAGVEFYRAAVRLQRRFANGKRIENALQTNGVLLNEEWCQFLAENHFLVGLSVDGPREFHDRHRRSADGKSSFEAVVNALRLMQKHRVEFNTLTAVNACNSSYPIEVYRFLKQAGSPFMQFIPIVERPHAGTTLGASSSVAPVAWGKFLCAIFDEWVRNDVGRVYVQIFDAALESWFGRRSSLCIFSETCGQAMALEHNGDLYACDHFVDAGNFRGNITETSLSVLARSTNQLRFGDEKRNLPGKCLQCEFLFACRGECPKNRLGREGEPRLNYLCDGYKLFFRHIDPYMRFMAQELEQGRPPMNVMYWARQREVPTSRLGRNDLCVCGSGRKYKKCCGFSTA